MRRMQTLLALAALFAIALSGCSSNSSNTVNPPVDEDLTPPAAPLNLAIAVNDGYLTLSWEANSEIDLAGYRIYRQMGQETEFSYLADWPYARFNDACGGQGLFSYSYRVTAVDDSGNESAYSTPVQTVIDNLLPEPQQAGEESGFADFHYEH